jgi:hypothetical protein
MTNFQHSNFNLSSALQIKILNSTILNLQASVREVSDQNSKDVRKKTQIKENLISI